MKKTLAILALGLTAIAGHAATPLWMRDVQISPDGTEIAFCYKGDIYKVPAKGGTATQLTTQESYECTPIWSPDGKQIAFASDRYGNFDVFVMPADGGTAQRLTTHSTGEIPSTFTPDGKYILFSASIQDPASSALFPTSAMTELYKVPATGGRTEQVLGTPAEAVCFDKAGHQFLYQDRKGFEDEWRKHHISSITRDIWLYDAKTGTHTNLTDRAGEDRNPVLSPDGRTVYFLSERNGGSFNVYAFPLAQPREVKPITSFKTHPVRFLSMSDGGTLCYSYDGEIYTQQPDATPKKVAIELVRDDRPQFSPDGKELAFIEDRIRLMVLNLETKKVRQITDGSTWYSTGGGFDYAWSPDGKWFTLEFTGNKHDPYSDIGLVSAEGGKDIINLTNSGYMSGYPRFALDGNAILFTTERYGMRAHASWGSLNDAMLVFLNQDAYDKYCLSKEDYELRKELEKEQKKSAGKDTPQDKNKDKKKKDDKKDSNADEKDDQPKDIVVELKGIEDRVVRLTPNSSDMGSTIISKDGETLYYLAAFEGGYDLWKMNLRKKETRLLHKMDAGWADMQLDKDGKSLFLLGSHKMQKMDTSSDALTPITFQVDAKMDLAAEREYMFDHVYRQQQKRFYNTNMHGVDWDKMTAAYRRFLPHIDNNYDFAELLSEWLGELNVSHTGGRFYPKGQSEPTASLGLFFDWNYTGKGMLIAEVVEKGPFDTANTRVKAGTVIEKIDGVEITPDADYYTLLNNKARKKTLVSLFDPQTKEHWEEVIIPITNGAFSDLLYSRWVKQRAADVDRWSGGRLGYVHIESMGDDSFRSVYSDILGKYNNREGIVIDTRFNGGGRLHEDIEILFSGQKYFTQVVRGRETCDMPSRRWNKPSIMVMCEANYSNAHGTPWVYSHRGLGKLVGMPVPGTMTSVSWERLQDPSLVFGIPVVGYRLPDGSYLENSQLEPDIKVANSPETIVKGEDTQLKAAVEELLKELKK